MNSSSPFDGEFDNFSFGELKATGLSKSISINFLLYNTDQLQNMDVSSTNDTLESNQYNKAWLEADEFESNQNFIKVQEIIMS
jgi:hypothetical protein